MDRNPFPAALVRELIDYDSATGLLTWKTRPLDMFPSEPRGRSWNARFAGKPAFTADCQGYKMGNMKWARLYAHQVAWAHQYGEWPKSKIDHVNGDRSDNSILNLRVVTDLENSHNVKLHKRNKSGVSGVDFSRGKWRVRICVDKKSKTIGRYDCKDYAISVRKKMEADLGYHPNHGRVGA